MLFPSHPSPNSFLPSRVLPLYWWLYNSRLHSLFVFFVLFCFVCMFVWFFLRGRGGEGRGGSGKNDWVIHIAFLVLILADGGGVGKHSNRVYKCHYQENARFCSSRVLIQNLKSFIRYRKPMQSLIHSFEINCGVKMWTLFYPSTLHFDKSK